MPQHWPPCFDIFVYEQCEIFFYGSLRHKLQALFQIMSLWQNWWICDRAPKFLTCEDVGVYEWETSRLNRMRLQSVRYLIPLGKNYSPRLRTGIWGNTHLHSHTHWKWNFCYWDLRGEGEGTIESDYGSNATNSYCL